ncbi:medium-chain acyl-CoA ligase ACSF2, mitochondrial-like [Ornithodoros turicata]|uniref:medium-chain acyl-CoA ligase ACSF2, mitochondrial-like n=1 Tax=Ornithodoros turicata TaxID=34597 RepID=UPI003138FA8A
MHAFATTLLRKVALGRALHLRQWCSRQLSPTAHKLTSSYYFEPHTCTLMGNTFGDMINRAAAQWGGDVGWIFSKECKHITYGEYKNDVDKACRGLLAAGLQKGNPVALCSPNTYHWLVMYGALAKSGIVSACIHPSCTPSELETCLKKADCAGIYVPESFETIKYYQLLNDMIPELKNSPPGQLRSKRGCINLRDIFDGGSSDIVEVEKNVSFDDPLTIIFTSGTTGTPKAAAISHHGFVNNVVAYHYRNPFDRCAVTMGGTVCTTDSRKLVGEKYNAAVVVGYGATETSTVACVAAYTDPEVKKMTTVGKPLPFTEAKIADPLTGKETSINEPGEVWIRGHNVFLGYYGEEAKTREVITPARWYKTGDIGTMDEDGYVTITGRSKDVVIRGGENVYPVEVEGVLNGHPDVHEAFVLGVPNERMGEELCAWIVPKESSNIKDEELREHCKGKISRFKTPKYFVHEREYPKTSIGKPKKQEMRTLAVKKLGL